MHNKESRNNFVKAKVNVYWYNFVIIKIGVRNSWITRPIGLRLMFIQTIAFFFFFFFFLK